MLFLQNSDSFPADLTQHFIFSYLIPLILSSLPVILTLHFFSQSLTGSTVSNSFLKSIQQHHLFSSVVTY